MDSLNHKMISLARESRGKTQSELARLINIPQGNLSRMERGDVGVKEDILQSIADVLNYPISFFTQKYNVYPPDTHYRKKVSVSQKVLLQADALMNIYRFNIQEMLKSLDISTGNIPALWEQYESPEKIAQFLRGYWKVPKGTITDLSKLIEDNGIIVIQMDFGTDKIDGRSVVTDTGHPIIFINKKASGDRQRLTLAHELGHIIMHMNTLPTFGRDEEDEAFRFASEFLMPISDVHHEISGKLSLERLANLKIIWRISMQSILFRAQKLNLITPNHARYLWMQIASRGYKVKEPIEIPQEQPTLSNRMANMFLTELEYSKEDLTGLFNLNKEEVEERYLQTKGNKLRVA